MAQVFQKIIYLIAFQIIVASSIFGKQDSTLRRYIGIETGYLTYSSRDDIFSTFIYSGSAPYFSFNKLATTRKTFRNLKISFSVIKRRLEGVNAPETFMIIGQDNNIVYKWDAEAELRTNNTYIAIIHHDYYRRIRVSLFQQDCLYLGFVGKFEVILRNNFSNPELISYSINPGFLYKISLKNYCDLLFENNLNVLGISIRKPYSGVDPQLTDDYDFSFIKDYAYNHAQVDLINSYFQYISQIKIEKVLMKKFVIALGYKFDYLNLDKPRELVSVSNNFSIGISYKIK